METKMETKKVVGYLPDERPPLGKLLLYALQQVIVMFPATITVALITGFQVSTTIFASGLATLCFTFITGRKLPLYYGSSFAYLSAISGLIAAQGFQRAASGILPVEAIQIAQFGIIASGLVSIAAGFLVKFAGREAVEKVLPPAVTGPVAMIIGLTLAGNALHDAAPAVATGMTDTLSYLPSPGSTNMVWVVSLATLLSTIFFSKYLKGFLGQLPLLLGAGVGCLTALCVQLLGGEHFFRSLPPEVLSASTWKLGDGSIFALPAFSLPKVSWAAVVAIMPIAIATIPESTAHVYQLDIYVNDVARKKGATKKYDMVSLLDRNLIGDGLCDMISGVVGGPAGTNYGENISTMAITRVFSVPVLMVASIIAMVVSCFTPLIGIIYGIPLAVIGGLEIYLFGAIAAQGIAILIDKKCDMFSAKNIAVIACIMVIGLGTNFIYGGTLNLFGLQVPAIAGAAIFGILLNLLLSIGEKKGKAAEKGE
ncbi:MAG: solute carrier family 23 protein [Clostridiaceae bacterium]|nr:xanthine permease [Eubacteriales bacterium]